MYHYLGHHTYLAHSQRRLHCCIQELARNILMAYRQGLTLAPGCDDGSVCLQSQYSILPSRVKIQEFEPMAI